MVVSAVVVPSVAAVDMVVVLAGGAGSGFDLVARTASDI